MSRPEPAPARASAAFFDEERDAYVLGPMRVALSALLFLNCARLVLELQSGGYFGDFFHLPIWPEAWVPSRSVYVGLLALQALAALLAFFGVGARGALLIGAGVGLFLLGCDRLQYHNNRYALLLFGLLLAFTPCDRSWRLARRPRTLPEAERIGPTFARKLLQIQASLVYLSSACGKLFDPDWFGGQVLRLRFESVAPFWASHGVRLPHALEAALSSPIFASFAAKIAISTELFIALGLWFPRARRLALWVGVMFHFWIEVSARVELFSYAMGSAYFAFVSPELRRRRFEYDPASRRARAFARALPWLDWCARFEVGELAAGTAREFRVVDRAGVARSGLRGVCALAEAIPLLFPLWAPLALVTRSKARVSAA